MENTETPITRIYGNIGEETSESVKTETCDGLAATPGEFVNVWRHFRMTEVSVIKKYNFPVDNNGKQVQWCPILSLNENITYNHVRHWFIEFAMNDYDVLIINTHVGGIYIRKNPPGETFHKFVTADLPGEPYSGFAVASFEVIVPDKNLPTY